MGIENKKIKELVYDAVNGNINVPEFQREFVWKPQNVKFLAESLYLRYPIGLILLWKSSAEVEGKHTSREKNVLWLVDGQQRVTSFGFLFGKKPYWWPNIEEWNAKLKRMNVYISIKSEEISLWNPRIENDPKWISFREILGVEEKDKSKIIKSKAKQISKLTGMDYFDVIERLNKIYSIRDMEIPTLTIDHEPEDVAEIFVRLNKSGTTVKEADIILSLIASMNEGWVKNEFIKYRNDLESIGWDFDPIILLRTVYSIAKGKSIIASGTNILKEMRSDFWKRDIGKYWKITKRIINEVIYKFRYFGILSLDLIPSKNSLIPAFILYHKFGKTKQFRFEGLLYWLLIANYAGRYSGAALYAIQTDVSTIINAKNFKDAINSLLNNIKDEENIDPMQKIITEEDILGATYQDSTGKFVRLVMYLIMFKKGAKDWVTKTRIGFEKGSTQPLEGFTPEWHHIYPKNILKKRGFEREKIDCVANITVLMSKTNKKFKREPWEYIWDYKISTKMLRDHLIPSQFKGYSTKIDKRELKKIWNIRNYNDFLSKRAKKLEKEIHEYLTYLMYS